MIVTSFRRRPHGFSLVEVAVSLVILGVVTLLLVQFMGVAQEHRQAVAQRDLMTRADDALLAFVMVNNRLPCPASDGGGNENCGSPNEVGRLPFRTLGLPDAHAGRIRYGVLKRLDLGAAENDAALTDVKPRFQALQATPGGAGLVFASASGNNGIDFCRALRTSMRQPVDASFLHTLRAPTPSDPSTPIARNVAYALALPTAPDGFGFANANDAVPAFESPRRVVGVDYHDQVRAAAPAQLWTRMHCGDAMAASGHAHFNVALATTVMRNGLENYRKQLGISHLLSAAAVTAAVAANLTAAADIATAAAGLLEAIASSVASLGGMTWEIGLAIAATVAAAAAAAASIITTGFAAAAEVAAQEDYDESQTYINETAALEGPILLNAQNGYSAGMYGSK